MRYFVMTITFLFLLICSLQAQVRDSCKSVSSSEASSSNIVYEGGNGTSFSDAVIIKGAPNSKIGVPAEYKWLAKNLPGFRMFKQKTATTNGKRYDIIYVENTRGDTRKIYFDITDFFGN